MYYAYDRVPCLRLFEADKDKSMVDKVNRIVSLGEDKVTKHFNIIKIIKNLRDIKHVVIHHLNKAEDSKNNKDKFMKQVAQNQKRVIQIVPEFQDLEDEYYDDMQAPPEDEIEMQDKRSQQDSLNLMEVQSVGDP